MLLLYPLRDPNAYNMYVRTVHSRALTRREARDVFHGRSLREKYAFFTAPRLRSLIILNVARNSKRRIIDTRNRPRLLVAIIVGFLRFFFFMKISGSPRARYRSACT